VALAASGLVVAGLLALVVNHTRAGMLIRAGASNQEMVSALGVDIGRLFRLVFGVGAMLAGFAGVLAGPLVSVEPGMGENLLILAFVVIVIGGIGSIRGAFVAAIIVGLVDTLGRALITDLAKALLSGPTSARVGPALASMLIYLVMASVLAVRPAGLFPARA
jgi:branched-chain amino acid transport system permease protein